MTCLFVEIFLSPWVTHQINPHVQIIYCLHPSKSSLDCISTPSCLYHAMKPL